MQHYKTHSALMPLKPRLIKTADFLWFIAKRFDQDRCMQAASSLTFTTLLALVPIFTIALTIFSAFPVFSDYSNQIRNFILNNLVPAASAKVIGVYVQQFSENVGKLTAVGIIALVITALMVMQTIESAFNTIWRVSRPRPLIYRILIYWAILTIGPLFIGVSLSLTSWLIGFTTTLKQMHWITAFLLSLVPFLLTTLTIILLFMLVPNRRVPRTHAMIGGAVAGLAFELMKSGFGWYISNFTSYKIIYGAFASFPVFLIWLYFSWFVILLGAVITACISYWHGEAWRHKETPAYQFFHALCILKTLDSAHHTGRVVALAEIRAQVNLGVDEIEALLERLITVNWVRRVVGQGWVLAIDLNQIRLADVFELLLFDVKSIAEISSVAESSVFPILKNVQSKLYQEINTPLTTLFAQASTKAN
jgi:membrane protein